MALNLGPGEVFTRLFRQEGADVAVGPFLAVHLNIVRDEGVVHITNPNFACICRGSCHCPLCGRFNFKSKLIGKQVFTTIQCDIADSLSGVICDICQRFVFRGLDDDCVCSVTDAGFYLALLISIPIFHPNGFSGNVFQRHRLFLSGAEESFEFDSLFGQLHFYSFIDFEE